MIKIMCVCLNGMGSSLMFRNKVQSVCKRLNVEASVEHRSLSEAKGQIKNVDVVCCAKAIEVNFKDVDRSKTKVVSVVNLMSEKEIEEKLREQNIITG